MHPFHAALLVLALHLCHAALPVPAWSPLQNHLGVQRMCRMLASLQPALSGVGTTGTGSFRPEAARAFDRGEVEEWVWVWPGRRGCSGSGCILRQCEHWPDRLP